MPYHHCILDRNFQMLPWASCDLIRILYLAVTKAKNGLGR
jgi:hypothetical protein